MRLTIVEAMIDHGCPLWWLCREMNACLLDEHSNDGSRCSPCPIPVCICPPPESRVYIHDSSYSTCLLWPEMHPGLYIPIPSVYTAPPPRVYVYSWALRYLRDHCVDVREVSTTTLTHLVQQHRQQPCNNTGPTNTNARHKSKTRTGETFATPVVQHLQHWRYNICNTGGTTFATPAVQHLQHRRYNICNTCGTAFATRTGGTTFATPVQYNICNTCGTTFATPAVHHLQHRRYGDTTFATPVVRFATPAVQHLQHRRYNICNTGGTTFATPAIQHLQHRRYNI